MAFGHFKSAKRTTSTSLLLFFNLNLLNRTQFRSRRYEREKVRWCNCLNLDVQDEKMKRIMIADDILD
ncbi:MAG: hypothetical protein MUF15_07720 [Acidobacteria bacterium]|nr:hypothetical protein [Acidobacteriota bacterium]